MIGITRNIIVTLLVTAIFLLAGCGNTSTAVVSPPAVVSPQAEAPKTEQSSAAQPSTQPVPAAVQTNSAAGSKSTAPGSTGATSAEPLSTRVDVIYFHVNQRCVTCLCFEDHVNKVIEKYYGADIASGKLTYRVLNAQLPENVAIAKKYGAVGSQLFVNRVVNGYDDIEDIQNIWNWNCRNAPNGFELKVKDIIDLSLAGKR